MAGRRSLIDDLEIADDVLKLARTKTHDEIAEWIEETTGRSLSRTNVGRWLAKNEKPEPKPSPVAVATVEKSERVIRTAKRSGSQPNADGVHFIAELKEIIRELREIYANPEENVRLRNTAIEYAVTATLAGQGLTNEWVEIQEMRES